MNASVRAAEVDGDSTESDLLTIGETAALVRTPVATLRYWRHIGFGPHGFRVGRGVRYWRHEVVAWLREQSDGDRESRPGSMIPR